MYAISNTARIFLYTFLNIFIEYQSEKLILFKILILMCKGIDVTNNINIHHSLHLNNAGHMTSALTLYVFVVLLNTIVYLVSIIFLNILYC